jgi:hypothetical protein
MGHWQEGIRRAASQVGKLSSGEDCDYGYSDDSERSEDDARDRPANIATM